MTEVDVMNDLMFCGNRDCENCSRFANEGCNKSLLKDARTIIKLQMEAIKTANETIEKANEEIGALRTAVTVSYTKEQLVKAVNGIIYAMYDEDDDRLWSQAYSVGQFMKLVGVRGHIAVDYDAKMVKIHME